MLFSILNAFAVLAVISINALANALPINGQNTGEISNRFPLLITPSGWAFSIWALIYSALLAFAVYGFTSTARNNPIFPTLSYLFLLSCLANVAWIFSWHYEFFPLSLVAMTILLICLISIYLLLNVGRTNRTGAELLFIEAPFRIYLGWITVATVVNVSLLLFQHQWNGWGIEPEIWTNALLGVVFLLGLLAIAFRKDWIYTAVLLWATIAVALKPGQLDSVKMSGAMVGTGLSILTLLGLFLKKPLL